MRKVALICFLFTWTLTTHGKFSASGDEPHYLMIAQSIVADHDIDLANNYARNDGRLFGHDGLAAGLHALPSRTGRLRPIHDIGLAVGGIVAGHAPLPVTAHRGAGNAGFQMGAQYLSLRIGRQPRVPQWLSGELKPRR